MLPSLQRSTLVSLFILALFGATQTIDAQSNAHLGHVADKWGDTPGEIGLLTAAEREANTVLQHATLAMQSQQLAQIKAHLGHVIHALDPTVVERGPGLGYGLIKAAKGVARHVGLAGEAADATPAAKAHSTHVKTSAENVAAWSESILKMAEEARATTDREVAAELAEMIQGTAEAIVDGQDADGDGRIGWGEDEGGLKQARMHLGFMRAT